MMVCFNLANLDTCCNMNFDEKDFSTRVKPHLLRCRPGDWEHSLRVVHWVKILGKDRDDLHLLIKAAYVHDIGWRDVLPNRSKLSREKLMAYEAQANANSEPHIRALLGGMCHPENDIEVILRLVRAADSHQSNDYDEAILVDADNLSKLSVAHLRGKYKKSDWTNMLYLWKREFPLRIQTEAGKDIYPKLIESLEEELLSGQQQFAKAPLPGSEDVAS